MNELSNSYIFYTIAGLIILFISLTIKFENIVYSLLSAICVFILAGVLFFVLGSEYNAIVQIAIYGIAIPIITGLSIMYTDTKNSKPDTKKKKNTIKYLIITAISLFILAGIYITLISLDLNSQIFNTISDIKIQRLNNMDYFMNGFFTKYVISFEIISLILTITAIGLTLFKKEGKTL